MRPGSPLLLLLAAILFPASALADCAFRNTGPGRFVYPEKTWLPANAKGALFIYPRQLSFKPRNFLGFSTKERADHAEQHLVLEPVTIPKGHVLNGYISEDERLWRIGVKGGFKPGVRYTFVFHETGSFDPDKRVEFLVGPAAFDTSKIRPRITADSAVRRLSHGPYAWTGAVAIQQFGIADTSSQAALAGGLTVLTDEKFEEIVHGRVSYGGDGCSWQPVGPMLADLPVRSLLWRDCPIPNRVEVHAWLGMLEVDERFVPAPPVTMHRSDSIFGICSLFGRTMDGVLKRFGL